MIELAEWLQKKFPTMPRPEAQQNVQRALEYCDQHSLVLDLLMRTFAEELAGDPVRERYLYTWARNRYDSDAADDDFVFKMDTRADNELIDGLPTLSRPRVLLANLGDGLLPPRMQA